MPAALLSPPLFQADTVTPTVAGQKDGKLRIVYAGWDDAKVLFPGEWLKLVCIGGQVHAYRQGKPKHTGKT